MEKLFFGTAGIPLSTNNPTTITGIQRVRELNLDAMELEFVHSVNLSEERAEEVSKIAEFSHIHLTCHGQYYINLNAVEKDKVDASIGRVINAARIASLAGASSMTFHAGFYLKDSPELTFKNIKSRFDLIISELSSKKINITIRPETTGKKSQFGSLEELLELSRELGSEKVLPCIDFSHLHARSNGKVNSYKEFRSVLEQSEKALGKSFLKNLHCHVSGIAYSEKGERNHLNLQESDLKYKELLRALKEFDCAGIIICESPSIEQDALLLKKEFDNL